MNKNDVLARAGDLLLGDRQDDYGDATRAHARIAQAWGAIMDRDVTAHQVALCMAALKLIRATTSPDKADSYVDCAAYAAIASECVDAAYDRAILSGRTKPKPGY